MAESLELLGALAETGEIRSLLGELPATPPRRGSAAGRATRPGTEAARTLQGFLARVNWGNDPAFVPPADPASRVPGDGSEEAESRAPVPLAALGAGAFFQLVNWANAPDAPAWPSRAAPAAAPGKLRRVGEAFNVENVLASIHW